MGEGFAVKLTSGEVVSPFDGEIVMTFPTKHAYGLKSDDGLEVIIHLGMDTVELNGDGFECLVNSGQKVSQGQKIATVDLDFVTSHQKSLVSPVIFTSGEHIEVLEKKDITRLEPVVKIK